jgi:hypothetical protein
MNAVITIAWSRREKVGALWLALLTAAFAVVGYRQQHPPTLDVHYTATQPAPLRGGRPVMGSTVNGYPTGVVAGGTGLVALPGGTAIPNTPYVTVQNDGSTYFGTRGPLLGGAGNLVVGCTDTTHQALYFDYSGTRYTAWSQGAGTNTFGNFSFSLNLNGAPVQIWSGGVSLTQLFNAGGTLPALSVYPSNGIFIGQTPADPGVNNLQVQGGITLGVSTATSGQVLMFNYAGTPYRLIGNVSNDVVVGDVTFDPTILEGDGNIQLWSKSGNTVFYNDVNGVTISGEIFPSGGWYVGGTPVDPGANNLTVQGITNQAGGSVEHWRGIADANFVGATSDRWIAFTSISTARTGTIPCTVAAGQRFTVVDASGSASAGNTITISASSGAIHGGTNVINTAYGAKDYVSDGTNCVNVSGLL